MPPLPCLSSASSQGGLASRSQGRHLGGSPSPASGTKGAGLALRLSGCYAASWVLALLPLPLPHALPPEPD